MFVLFDCNICSGLWVLHLRFTLGSDRPVGQCVVLFIVQIVFDVPFDFQRDANISISLIAPLYDNISDIHHSKL